MRPRTAGDNLRNFDRRTQVTIEAVRGDRSKSPTGCRLKYQRELTHDPRCRARKKGSPHGTFSKRQARSFKRGNSAAAAFRLDCSVTAALYARGSGMSRFFLLLVAVFCGKLYRFYSLIRLRINHGIGFTVQVGAV